MWCTECNKKSQKFLWSDSGENPGINMYVYVRVCRYSFILLFKYTLWTCIHYDKAFPCLPWLPVSPDSLVSLISFVLFPLSPLTLLSPSYSLSPLSPLSLLYIFNFQISKMCLYSYNLSEIAVASSLVGHKLQLERDSLSSMLSESSTSDEEKRRSGSTDRVSPDRHELAVVSLMIIILIRDMHNYIVCDTIIMAWNIGGKVNMADV